MLNRSRKIWNKCATTTSTNKNNNSNSNNNDDDDNNNNKNSKYRLCDDRDETINHIISECSKLAQKDYKTRHYWAGKVINKMCKKFKFDYMNKSYLPNPSARAGYDTWSIFKGSLTGLNSEFSFS